MPSIPRRDFLLTAAAGLAIGPPALAAAPKPAAKPLVFGHRGACALRPEHTLASYAKAIADGADVVEPDLCCTKDGVLIARHEPDISETTDIAAHPEFAGRKTTRTLDGQSVTGWFVDDFTLAELKTLRAVERIPKIRAGNVAYDGQFTVPTFEEMIEFVAAESSARGRLIGITPELKHSTYFAARGLPLEDRFVAVLNAHEYTRRAPVWIQSFEVGNLKALRARLGRPANIKLLQLADDGAGKPGDVLAAGGGLTYGRMLSAEGLKEVALYADVICPATRTVIPLGPDQKLAQPSNIVRDAHAVGLLAMVYTFRPENVFLAADFRDGGAPEKRNEAGSTAEIRRYLATGLDGFFTDDPGLGRRAVDAAG